MTAGATTTTRITARLTTATKTGSSLSLEYDASGRLNSSTLNGTKTTFLYDGNELVAEYNSSGTLLKRYVHGVGSDDPLVSYDGSGTTSPTYLLADERGSIVAETNASGTVATKHQYGPYGEPINTSPSRFRYTGQILLPGTELYHYKARVYHPKLGRFLQTDPIGYKDGMNWYAYVGNDPMNGVDPEGKSRLRLYHLKKALREVHKKLGGKLPKNNDGGKFGSSVHGDSKKGYRLDKEGHPNAEPGTPDADGPHINYWDYTKMKAKEAIRLGKLDDVKGAVRVGDTAKKATMTIVAGAITGLEYVEKNMPRTTQLVEFAIDPIGTLSESQNQNNQQFY